MNMGSSSRDNAVARYAQITILVSRHRSVPSVLELGGGKCGVKVEVEVVLEGIHLRRRGYATCQWVCVRSNVSQLVLSGAVLREWLQVPPSLYTTGSTS